MNAPQQMCKKEQKPISCGSPQQIGKMQTSVFAYLKKMGVNNTNKEKAVIVGHNIGHNKRLLFYEPCCI